MTEHRHYSGPDLALLLRQVRDELGSNAEILRAERIRSGGLAGFFAREHYEVVAKRPAVPSEATPADVKQRPDDETIADEPIGKAGRSTGPAAPAGAVGGPETAMQASLGDPATTEPGLVKGGTGRSIQAALLDRADRVSTEELLVRIAETHSPEWDSESFQSILGRAMVDAVGPSVDAATTGERRRDHFPVEIGPDRAHETIDGLRLEPIGPGENVVDPVPQPPVEPSAAAQGGAPNPEDETDADHSMSSPVSEEDRWIQPNGPGAPQWASGIAPAWGPPWVQGWAPWTMNGWPAPYRLCASCADALPEDDHDDLPASPTLDGGTTEEPDGAAPWSELRREIDDLRLRLDEIIGIIRHATAYEDVDGDRQTVSTGLNGDEGSTSGRERTMAGADAGPGSGDRRRPPSGRSEPGPSRDRPDRRTKNNRRSGRTGR